MTDSDRPAHLRPAQLRRPAATPEPTSGFDVEGMHEHLEAIIDAIVELRDRIGGLEREIRDLAAMVDVTSDALAAQIRNALEHVESSVDAGDGAAARRSARRAARRQLQEPDGGSDGAASEPATLRRQRKRTDSDQ